VNLATDHSKATLVAPEIIAPHASRAERLRSFDVADFPMPNGREEEWRFTRLRDLVNLMAGEPSTGQLTCSADLPAGVTATAVTRDEAIAAAPFAPSDRTAALAVANAETTRYTIPAEFTGPPLRVELSGTAGTTVWGHLQFDVGANAQATVVLRHTGSAQYSARVELVVGSGADVTFVTIQEWDDDAIHLAENVIRVGAEARVKHVAVSLGGRTVRITTNVDYAGEGGELTLLGAYFADADQHLEHQTFVDHNQPRGTSDVTYKGALQGDGAHSVWIGDVLIRPEAEGINTYELNRNLVLTDGARADSVPNLEIETGEIEGAGHAAATGRFDDEQLFYLQSRGIPEQEARRLVVRGFFADLIAAIRVPDVEAEIMGRIDAELDMAMDKPVEEVN